MLKIGKQNIKYIILTSMLSKNIVDIILINVQCNKNRFSRFNNHKYYFNTFVSINLYYGKNTKFVLIF